MHDRFRVELQERRRKLSEILGATAALEKGDALLLFSAPVYVRNGDVEHNYRQHSDFYYLTGFEEPEAALLLFADEPHFILFVRERDREKEIWDGRRAGTEGAVDIYGATKAHSITELAQILPEYLKNRRRLHYLFGEEPAWDRTVFDAVAAVRRLRKQRVTAPTELIDARSLVHEARLLKSEYEQEKMSEVAALSAGAHAHAMCICQPGRNEWDLASGIDAYFRKGGARRAAYGSIVGSGKNGTILHYHENESEMVDGSLVLIDAGAEKDYLAADITRTFPVNGKFSEVQKRLYEIVLRAQLVAIDKACVGNSMEDVHNAAVETLTQGLIAEGLMSEIDLNDEKSVTARLRHFYMHQTSHYIGMDVHDVGAYHQEGQLRSLEATMVITVEPGLYIAADDDTVPVAYRGIGIRIEDDILITAAGPKNLSIGAPKTVAEIEAAFKARSTRVLA